MKLRIHIFFLLLAILLPLSMCPPACSALFVPVIADLTVTSGLDSWSRPVDICNSFFIDTQQVCCSARLERAHKNTAVTARWMLVNGNHTGEHNQMIHEDTLYLNTDGHAGFTLLAPQNGFISGDYRVEILVDGRGCASGNFTIQKDMAGTLPQIQLFTLNPAVITSGQQTVMSWCVSGATRIHITPSPGQVNAEGKMKLTPASETAYTLTAVNRSGSSSNTIGVKVMPLITARADLEIIDFWNTGNILFYRIRNNGNLPSCPCFSSLYKNGIFEARDYNAPLSPGEERVESFANYHFSPRFGSITGSSLQEGESDAVNMRICLNQPASCEESNSENNCLDHNFGPLLTINLLRFVAKAQWQNNLGALQWPITKTGTGGWAVIGTAVTQNGSFNNAVLLNPGIDKNGWIQAVIGIPHGTPEVIKPFTIPYKSRLCCKIALSNDAPEGATARFMIGTRQGDKVEFQPPVNIKSKGKPENYEVDFSKLAGKQVEFVVRVESGGTLQQGSVAWIDPVLIQDK